jgi:uncharacterized membrane protein
MNEVERTMIDSGILEFFLMWITVLVSTLVVGALAFTLVHIIYKRKRPQTAEGATTDKEEPLSTIGVKESTAAAIAYSLGIITGIIFLYIEKKSEFVRFHAMQSVITFGLLGVAQILLVFVPILSPFAGLLGLLGVFLWIYLMVKAQAHQRILLPVVGNIMAQIITRRDD